MDGNQANEPERTAAAQRPAKSARRPFIVLFAVVGAGLLALGGYAYGTRNQEATDDAQVEADVLPLAPRVGGALKQVLLRENQRIRGGDVAFVLDDADFKLRVAQAEAELSVARAQAAYADAKLQVVEASARGGLRSAKAEVSGSEVEVKGAASRVEVARAALERAKADARKADLELGRSDALRRSNALAQRDLDLAQANDDAARAALTQAEAALVSAEESRRAALSHVAESEGKLTASAPIDAQIAAARAEAALAHAREQAAEAALALKRLDLSYTEVRAPAAGVVSKLGVHAGQLVSANQPLAELVPDATYLVANFKETQIGRMRAGDRAAIELDAYPGRTFAGVVESLASGTGARFSLLPADNASGNFVKVVQRVPVRIAWQRPPDVALAAGLSANVTVDVTRSDRR